MAGVVRALLLNVEARPIKLIVNLADYLSPCIDVHAISQSIGSKTEGVAFLRLELEQDPFASQAVFNFFPTDHALAGTKPSWHYFFQ